MAKTLKCPRCGKAASPGHFGSSAACRDAAARVGGMAASLMRTTFSGGRRGGVSTVSYSHRDQMANRRGETTLKVPFNSSIVRVLGLDPTRTNPGQARNLILQKLDMPPMSIRSSNTISARFPGSRIQLDFRRADVATLWSRFKLGSREQSLGALSAAIEDFLTKLSA